MWRIQKVHKNILYQHFPDIFYLSGRQGTSAGLKPFCSKGAELCKFHRSSSCCGCSNTASCSVLPEDVSQVLLSVLGGTDLVSADSWGCTATFPAGKVAASGSGWELGQVTLEVTLNSFPRNPTCSRNQAGFPLGADGVRTHQDGVRLLISAARRVLLKKSSNWQQTKLGGKLQINQISKWEAKRIS